MTIPFIDRPGIEPVIAELLALRAELLAAEEAASACLNPIHPNFRESARNLLHYLALRRRDLRPIQQSLAEWGLSSLGRSEAHVLATLEAVLGVLHQLVQRPWPVASADALAIDFVTGTRLLAEHTNMLLGPQPPQRQVRIMVTLPSEAADNYLLVHDLLKQGMNAMRINCAHDDATAWLRMIEHLKRAREALGLPCQIVMDLGGPKLRTGPLATAPAVVKIQPERNLYGEVIAPARIWLTASPASSEPPTLADACLPVSQDWLSQLKPGATIQLTDARQAKRSWTVVDITPAGAWAEATQTAYVTSGLVLKSSLPNKTGDKSRGSVTTLDALPLSENVIPLLSGDLLILTRSLEPGRPATCDSTGKVLTPAHIGCTIPEIFERVQPGESIWFDDGKIGGMIETVETTQLRVRITRSRYQGEKLRGDKGINLPMSDLQLPALTAKDIEDIAFVAQHADIVGLSFVNSAQDIELLQQQLMRQGQRQPAIMLKIETQRGFENLPTMLLTAMQAPCCGVMIARGDLAVECGFERLAEVQEEILWICEAAHVPVIWATQVLETLAKEGMPSRAEITDAAMGHRAECVMLNKGPHVLSAVRVLDDILQRMAAHQTKKQAMLRALQLAHRPIDGVV